MSLSNANCKYPKICFSTSEELSDQVLHFGRSRTSFDSEFHVINMTISNPHDDYNKHFDVYFVLKK